jgi:hypothetical protein
MVNRNISLLVLLKMLRQRTRVWRVIVLAMRMWYRRTLVMMCMSTQT